MNWCDRVLVVSPYYLGLAKSEKEFHCMLRHLRVPREEWPPFSKSDATTHYFHNHGTGRNTAIVCIRPNRKTIQQNHALLMHEAVHVWQNVRQDMGENHPSQEFEAYSIQSIAQTLMEHYTKK